MKDERENENQSRIHILNFFSTSRFLSNGAKNDIFMALIGPDTKNVAVNPLLETILSSAPTDRLCNVEIPGIRTEVDPLK